MLRRERHRRSGHAGLSGVRRTRGFSLVGAVFIITVFGLLAAALITLVQLSDDSVAREVLATRALHAAHSGAQWQLSGLFVTGGTCGTANITLPLSCSADIVCTQASVAGNTYYDIRSTGRCGPSGEQAVRVIEVKATDS